MSEHVTLSLSKGQATVILPIVILTYVKNAFASNQKLVERVFTVKIGTMRYVVVLGILISSVVSLSGCEWERLRQSSDCQPVSESVYVNQRYPNSVEPYSPDSANVVTFENGFNDTVSVWAGNSRLVSQFVETKSNGLAGRVTIKLRPNDEVTLRTAGGQCAYFRLRGGYKYIYVNKLGTNWAVEYANYGRGYF